ncbi:hypothetical protein DMB42_11440 [Nonomuraea sp. WAC 01424]|nr:hypothetical protein DMB42_11440 [Nonomuraea sp. WAC 01424]
MENFPVTVDWSDLDGMPITHVNQFLVQAGPPTAGAGPDGVYLVIGSIPPPFIPRDTEGQRQAIEALKATGIRVTIHGRYQMSRERLDELIQVLQQTADQYDALVDKAAAAQSEQGEEG